MTSNHAYGTHHPPGRGGGGGGGGEGRGGGGGGEGRVKMEGSDPLYEVIGDVKAVV